MHESSLIRDRWVRIFCDYSADPVWAKSGGNCELSDLPVSPALAARMRDWARVYERKDSGLLVKDWEHGRAHGAEGLAIARAVKRELPDWTVIYLDEAALERGWMHGKTAARRQRKADRARGVVSRRAWMRLFERRRKREYRGYFEYEIGPQPKA